MPGWRLTASRDEAERFIDRQIEEASALLGLSDDVNRPEEYENWTHEVERWEAYTETGLSNLIDDPGPAKEFHEAATGRLVRTINQPRSETFEYRQEAIRRGVHVLRSLKERLDFAIPGASSEGAITVEEVGELPRRVFLVHGRDEGLRERVARVLEKLDFEVVILGDEPNRGRTLIEKFEDHSLEIGFAVVILSADDFGRGPDDDDWPAAPNRARQNVVLELGYFMGQLGRRHVSALYAKDVELPSDLHGLGYVALVRDDWPFKLAAELHAAGFAVDLNRLS